MGRRLKRLAEPNEINIECKGPFSDAENMQRDLEYAGILSTDFRKKYQNLKSSPSRYKLKTSGVNEVGRVSCNNIQDPLLDGIASGHNWTTLSNWSLAEEIKRLITINSTYQIYFHLCAL